MKYTTNFEKHRDRVVVYDYKIFPNQADNSFQWGIKDLDKALILELCYGGTYDATYNATLWTPDMGEDAQFGAWTDVKHPNPTVATGITNIYKMQKEGNEQAIVIFKTDYEWVGNIADSTREMANRKKQIECSGHVFDPYPTEKYFGTCPIGIAIFEKDLNNVWVLMHCNKNIGSPGLNNFEPSDSVFQIGSENFSMYNDKIGNFAIDSTVENWDNHRYVSYFRKRPIWAINFYEFSAHANSSYEQNTIYVPFYHTIKKAITLEQHMEKNRDINSGWRGEPRIDKDIKLTYELIEPSKAKSEGLWDILAHRVGLDYNERTEKSFKVNQKILYQFDYEKQEYVVKK